MKNPINDIIALQNYILYCGVNVDIDHANSAIHADIIASSNLSMIWVNKINMSKATHELLYIRILLLNNPYTTFLVGLYLFLDSSRLKIKRPFKHNNITVLNQCFYIYQLRIIHNRSVLCIT